MTLYDNRRHVKLCCIVDSSVKTLLLRYFFWNNSDLKKDIIYSEKGIAILLLFISKEKQSITAMDTVQSTPFDPSCMPP